MQTKKQKIEELQTVAEVLTIENRKLIEKVIGKNNELIEADENLIKANKTIAEKSMELFKKNQEIKRYIRMMLKMNEKIESLEREVKVCRDIIDRLGDRDEAK